MASANLLIAIYYQILRDGLKTILENESGIRIRDMAKSREELFSHPSLAETELLLLDLDLPELNPAGDVRRLVEIHPDLKILALSDLEDAERTKSVMLAGASGHLLKKRGTDVLLHAIREVLAGNHYVCDDSLRLLIEIGSDQSSPAGVSDLLTDREREVLELICREMTNKEIAEQLSISVRTVDAHRRNLLQKTDARNTAGLVKFAIMNDLFRP